MQAIFNWKVFKMENPFNEIIQRLIEIDHKLNKLSLPSKEQTEIITRDELCKRLSLTEPTIIRWEQKGKIPCFRVGSCVRYNWEDVLIAIGAKTKKKN